MTCENCIYGKRVFDNFTGKYYYECSDIQIVRKIGDYSYFETASSKTIKECPYGKAKEKSVGMTVPTDLCSNQTTNNNGYSNYSIEK